MTRPRHHADDVADALIQAAVKNPFDRTPRLVLADRLDEVGEPERAEFIRLSCELEVDAVGRSEDCKRETDLFLSVFGDPPTADGMQVTNSFVWFDSEWEIDFPPDTPIGLVRNGMVEEVTAPLSWLMGSVCERCDGLGSNDTAFRCGDCRGSGGRTPGHLADIVARHPVTKVVVTDREPNEDDGEWLWASALDTSAWRFDIHRESLVWDIAKHLTGGRHRPESRSIVAQWWYPTRDAAIEALSRALVDLGRERAGLPNLNWEG